MPTHADPPIQSFGRGKNAEVVEIGLLLPSSWADELIEMSKHRGQSVAQILRGLIGKEISADRAERS